MEALGVWIELYVRFFLKPVYHKMLQTGHATSTNMKRIALNISHSSASIHPAEGRKVLYVVSCCYVITEHGRTSKYRLVSAHTSSQGSADVRSRKIHCRAVSSHRGLHPYGGMLL